MNDTKVLVLPIAEGTFGNPARASTAQRIAGIRRWGAIVWRDHEKPGGVLREYLASSREGRTLSVANLLEGAYVEFAIAYQRQGRIKMRRYYRVTAVLPDALHLLEVRQDDLPCRAVRAA